MEKLRREENCGHPWSIILTSRKKTFGQKAPRFLKSTNYLISIKFSVIIY